jgi:hypothetical protein
MTFQRGLRIRGGHPFGLLPGHEVIGGVLFAAALACLWRLVGSVIARDRSPARTLGLAGTLLLAPRILIVLPWVGLGAPFQASALENQHRYAVLAVDAVLVGAGFTVLRDAPCARSEHFSAAPCSPRQFPLAGYT